jgi:hypothetical protein
MDRSWRLTEGRRWRIFMRLLRFRRSDDILHQRAVEGGLLAVDLDLGTAALKSGIDI